LLAALLALLPLAGLTTRSAGALVRVAAFPVVFAVVFADAVFAAVFFAADFFAADFFAADVFTAVLAERAALAGVRRVAVRDTVRDTVRGMGRGSTSVGRDAASPASGASFKGRAAH